jgi:hypothetical protein
MLLIILGILLPVAAMPVRICLLDLEERTDDCCRTCNSDSKDCCEDVDPLPELAPPDGNFETPAFLGYALPPTIVDFVVVPQRIVVPACYARPPTRIAQTTARLAVLNVWRL